MFDLRDMLKMSLVFSLLYLLLLSFQAGTGSAEDLPNLVTVADNEMAVRRLPRLIPDRINVTVDFSLIKPSNAPRAALRYSLTDRDVVLLRERIEARGTDNYTWVGRVEGHELSTAVITVVNGIAVGHIDFDGQTYSLNPQNGGYQIVKKDAAMAALFYDDGRSPVIPQTEKKRSPAYPVNLAVEDGSRIDVLVLYTQKMVDTYGTGLAAKIQNFVDLANTAYTNSGINTQIKMVHSALFTDSNAAEDVSLQSALDYITGAADSKLTGTPPTAIQTLRETYQADLVSLLRVYSGTGSCGQGWVLKTDNNVFADWAFSVTAVRDDPQSQGQSYCVDTTFAHELGHNMGCAHDRAHDGTYGGAYSYSYGYGFEDTFGTVMSYISPHITYFSTPLVNYQGQPIGKDESQEDSADNAKTINNTRAIVANFRAATASGGQQNNCAVTVSSSLVVHIPIVTYSESNYWAALQYNSGDSTLTVAGAGAVTDASPYSSCTASTLSADFKLHIPVLMLNNVSYWADLQYSGSAFTVAGAGQN